MKPLRVRNLDLLRMIICTCSRVTACAGGHMATIWLPAHEGVRRHCHSLWQVDFMSTVLQCISYMDMETRLYAYRSYRKIDNRAYWQLCLLIVTAQSVAQPRIEITDDDVDTDDCVDLVKGEKSGDESKKEEEADSRNACEWITHQSSVASAQHEPSSAIMYRSLV